MPIFACFHRIDLYNDSDRDKDMGPYPCLTTTVWEVTIMAKFILSFLLFISCAEASDPWTKEEKYLETGVIALTVIDWKQTLDMASRPDYEDYNERNKILGEHPSRNKINNYFTLGIGAHVLMSNLLAHRERKIFQYASILVLGFVVYQNHQIGLNVNF